MCLNLFKKDKSIIQNYSKFLDNYVNWFDRKQRREYEDKQNQLYDHIVGIITSCLNNDLFDISIYPDTKPYLHNNHIYKSYILTHQISKIPITIVTYEHKEYGENVYETYFKATFNLNGSDPINIARTSDSCIALFELIEEYIVKNKLVHLLSVMEKRRYLITYITERTKSKKFVWEFIKETSSPNYVFRSKCVKCTVKYFTYTQTGEFTFSDHNNLIKIRLDKDESMQLLDSISEAVDDCSLNSVLLNLN